MAHKSRFTDGEKVLCFHGPLLYEAKCLKSEIREKHMKYFIHYSGWNKNWDEWVPDCRILKYNDTNLQKQKELAKTHLKTKKSKSGKATVKKENDKESAQKTVSEKSVKPKAEKKTPASASVSEQSSEKKSEPRKKKPRYRVRFLIDEDKVDVELKISFPDPLKNWLVDDWDLITRQKKILSLPARVTVDHVIANFVKEKVSVKGLSQLRENTIVQVANKIRDCFNILLGKMLLYKFERPQYTEILVEYPGSDMCQIYGAIHLLRLFTNLGSLLKSLVPVEDLTSLYGHLNDFTQYMSTNNNFFNLDDYVVASPEYHRRAL